MDEADRALASIEQWDDVIEENQWLSDLDVSNYRAADTVQEDIMGKFHVEARVHDDFTGSLVQVGSSL
jgi:hypothetical protein